MRYATFTIRLKIPPMLTLAFIKQTAQSFITVAQASLPFGVSIDHVTAEVHNDRNKANTLVSPKNESEFVVIFNSQTIESAANASE